MLSLSSSGRVIAYAALGLTEVVGTTARHRGALPAVHRAADSALTSTRTD